LLIDLQYSAKSISTFQNYTIYSYKNTLSEQKLSRACFMSNLNEIKLQVLKAKYSSYIQHKIESLSKNLMSVYCKILVRLH
jgi:uncharacterized protein YsxB (DUF464 family)